MNFEYTVIPAPNRTKNVKGVKTACERLALAFEETINEMASRGWEFLRTETLTVEDKPGRFSKTVERIETVLVFKRSVHSRPQVMSSTVNARPAVATTNRVEPSPYQAAQIMTQAPKAEHVASNGIIPESSTPSLGGVSRD